MTNARFCYAPRVAGSSLSPSRPHPFHFANRAHVTSEQPQCAASAAGFRLRLGGGRCAPAAFRYALLSALRSTRSVAPPADTQTEAERSRFAG